jgi:ketosteroid isomerase-like protein
MTEEDAIHAVLRELERAHERKDADALQACFAPDALIYNLAPPLAKRGSDPDGLDEWFATWDGPIHLEAAETEISVQGDLAVAAALNRMRGTKTDGETVDLWFRATTVLRRIEGRWLIVHDHTSTPFYMDGSQRAALDLVPQA